MRGKAVLTLIVMSMVLTTGFNSAKAENQGNGVPKVLEVRTRGERGTDNPGMYARDDGTWVKNSNGVWTYVDSTRQNAKNCWVKDGDGLYFIGYDGCLVKDNYTSDGFYVGPDGAWDSTRTQRTWDVDPYEGPYEGGGNIWIFSLPRDGNMDSVKVAYMQTGEVYMTCTLTSVGHGCMMAWPETSQNAYDQYLISVSDDKSTIRVSNGGTTDVCTYAPNSYYYDNSVQSSNNQIQNSNNQPQNYNNQPQNNTQYQNNAQTNNSQYEDYNSQAYYENVFPYSSLDTLEDWEIERLSDYELRIAINEIYARHGRKFKDKELQSYFDNTSWYVGVYEPADFDKAADSLLNKIEKDNIAKLVKERNKRK